MAKQNGGRRKGAGRKPDWFKMHCDDLLQQDKFEAIKYVGRLARGEESESEHRDRLKAVEFLADRAFGKPKQEVEVKGGMEINLIEAMRKSRESRGLDK